MYSVSMSFGGQTSAHRFLSVFNPPDSSVRLTLKRLSVIAYASGESLSITPFIASRVSSATGGTQQAASAINKFFGVYEDPSVVIRTDNPTVVAGPRIYSFAPPIQGATPGPFSGTPQTVLFDEGELLMDPGEGFALHQEAAGLVTQNYNVYVAWVEQPG